MLPRTSPARHVPLQRPSCHRRAGASRAEPRRSSVGCYPCACWAGVSFVSLPLWITPVAQNGLPLNWGTNIPFCTCT